MIWAILISSILLLTANLIYLLLKKRTEARKALQELGKPIKRRENILQRILRIQQTARQPIMDESAAVAPNRIDASDGSKAYEALIQQENALKAVIDDLPEKLESSLPQQDSLSLRNALLAVQSDWAAAAQEYNQRAQAYNDALRDFPGRILAFFLQMKHMPALKV